jgi:hypothetical protein
VKLRVPDAVDHLSVRHRSIPSFVMPGHSPSKTGVNALMPGHPRLAAPKDVDGQ